MANDSRLHAFLDGLTRDERDAADDVMRLPEYTMADVYMAVQQFRHRTETNEQHHETQERLTDVHARLDRLETRLDELATPTWKKAGYGLVGAAIAAGTWWAERGLR